MWVNSSLKTKNISGTGPLGTVEKDGSYRAAGGTVLPELAALKAAYVFRKQPPNPRTVGGDKKQGLKT